MILHYQFSFLILLLFTQLIIFVAIIHLTLHSHQILYYLVYDRSITLLKISYKRIILQVRIEYPSSLAQVIIIGLTELVGSQCRCSRL